jgi:hypothetical protein
MKNEAPNTLRPVTLRIELCDVEPLVWRRVIVSNQATLAALHNYLQWVMGWSNSHAHEFHVGEHIVAPDWWIEEMRQSPADARYRDERRVSVAALVKELGIRGEYEYHYDMGDGWQHRIVIEATADALADLPLPLPRCVAGENACPPDDVGGPHGYELFLQILADRRHKQHEDMVRWIGGVFDPKGFDLNRINRDWKGTKRMGR